MRVMARVLFSIAVLTIATPALARGDRDDDRRLSAEILNPKMAVFYYYRATVHFYMDRFDDAIGDIISAGVRVGSRLALISCGTACQT